MGLRWSVERTSSWLSNYGQLRRNTDRKTIHRLTQTVSHTVAVNFNGSSLCHFVLDTGDSARHTDIHRESSYVATDQQIGDSNSPERT